ncbi:MAG: TIGR02221 family CRISPR-associated protein [Bacteroidales bacterium]|nr:TIGR02221 family CRISPR-associated protein [Bacteroidales bacterium]MDY0215624.1 TIGR02221 family CRISPR-associated protein [Bacteroidales bacterium]
MARKVLISFLGTGRTGKDNSSKRQYETTSYKIEDKEYQSSFMADVLIQHLNIDHVIVIGTLKSMWEELYRVMSDGKTYDEEIALNTGIKIESFNCKTNVSKGDIILKMLSQVRNLTPIIINYGINQEEITNNINKILSIDSELKNDDEIFIDITHSFRSLPLILNSVINYVNEVSKKNIQIKGVYYGMLEVSNANELGYTPVVQLNSINMLNEYIKGAYEFQNIGSAYKMSELLKEENKSYSVILEDFSESQSLNHIYDLKSQVQKLKSITADKLTPIQEKVIIPMLNKFLNKFDNAKNDSQFQIELADWMFSHRQYGYSSIILIECIITKGCEMLRFDAADRNKREDVKKIITNSGKIKKNQDEFLKNFSNQQIDELKSFHTLWGNVNVIRKSVAHSIGIKLSKSKMIKDLEKYIEETKTIIYK